MNTIAMVHALVMLAVTSVAAAPNGLTRNGQQGEPMRIAPERPPMMVQKMAPDPKAARPAARTGNDDGLASDQVYRPVRKAVRIFRISASDCISRMRTHDRGVHWKCEFVFTPPAGGGTPLYLRNEVEKIVPECTTDRGRTLQCPVTAHIGLTRIYVILRSTIWQDSSGQKHLAQLSASQAADAFTQFFATYPQLSILYLKED